MRMLRLLACLGVLSQTPLARAEQAPSRAIEQVAERLDNWDIAAAVRLGERLRRQHPGDPDVELALARVRYFEGRYDDALELLDRLSGRLAPGAELAQPVAELRAFIAPIAETASRFRSHTSEHFEFLVVPGPDEVLVAEGLRVLEASWSEIGADFGVFPDGRIRVEIYPDSDSFQKASTLTREQIRTSGTIALCKFGKIMLLSPRLVLRGYPWASTLAHEYTHYVLWRRNGPSIPIWLHEGVARLQEPRWTGAPAADLDRPMKDVLADALREDALLSFEEMHPSFALIDDPRKVAIAGAQVLAVVRSVLDSGGYPRLERMLDELAAGAHWRSTFETVLGQSWESFEREFKRDWSQRLAGYGGRHVGDSLVQFADETERPEQAEQPAAGSALRRRVRLGELLAERGHYSAAAREYALAAEQQEPSHPLLSAWASSLERAELHAEAEPVLERALELEPERASTLLALGRVRRALGQPAAAARALEQSFRINPYNPSISELLAELYGALGDESARREAVANVASLRTRDHGQE